MSGVATVGIFLGGLALIIFAADRISWSIAKHYPSMKDEENKPEENASRAGDPKKKRPEAAAMSHI